MAAASVNSRAALKTLLLVAVLLCELYGAHAVKVDAPHISALSSHVRGCPEPTPGGPKPTATPVPPKPTSSPNAPYGAMEEQVRQMLDTIRSQAGLKPLKPSTVLYTGSRQWSRYLAENHQFYHASLRDPVYAENIAMGYTSAQAVTQGWQNSEGHRRNRMNPSYTTYGVGIWAASDGTLLFTERFGYDQ